MLLSTATNCSQWLHPPFLSGDHILRSKCVIQSCQPYLFGRETHCFEGPVLFLIYINDLPCALEKSEPDIYADDTGVLVSGEI